MLQDVSILVQISSSSSSILPPLPFPRSLAGPAFTTQTSHSVRGEATLSACSSALKWSGGAHSSWGNGATARQAGKQSKV